MIPGGATCCTPHQVVSDASTPADSVPAARIAKSMKALVGTGVWAAEPEIRVTEEGGPDYPVIMGDYAAEQARWESARSSRNTLERPTPLFTKLDETLGETGPDDPHRTLNSSASTRPRLRAKRTCWVPHRLDLEARLACRALLKSGTQGVDALDGLGRPPPATCAALHRRR